MGRSENYRTGGEVSLKPVLDMWQTHGMKTRTLNRVRINFECTVKISGSLRMHRIRYRIPFNSPGDQWPPLHVEIGRKRQS